MMECKGCTERTPGCHGHCKSYIEWSENRLKTKAIISKNRKADIHYISYAIGENNRMKKGEIMSKSTLSVREIELIGDLRKCGVSNQKIGEFMNRSKSYISKNTPYYIRGKRPRKIHYASVQDVTVDVSREILKLKRTYSYSKIANLFDMDVELVSRIVYLSVGGAEFYGTYSKNLNEQEYWGAYNLINLVVKVIENNGNRIHDGHLFRVQNIITDLSTNTVELLKLSRYGTYKDYYLPYKINKVISNELDRRQKGLNNTEADDTDTDLISETLKNYISNMVDDKIKKLEKRVEELENERIFAD